MVCCYCFKVDGMLIIGSIEEVCFQVCICNIGVQFEGKVGDLIVDVVLIIRVCKSCIGKKFGIEDVVLVCCVCSIFLVEVKVEKVIVEVKNILFKVVIQEKVVFIIQLEVDFCI